MYPLRSETLSLSSICDHWHRQLEGAPPFSKVLSSLLSAFWRGDLSARLPNEAGSDDQRWHFLNVVRYRRDHPGILVIEPGDQPPPARIEHSDGSLELDMTVRISWPDKIEDRETAYHALAEATLDDFSTYVQPALMALHVSKADFRSYCESEGAKLPPFWFSSERRAISLAATEARCSKWLKSLRLSG